MKKKPLILLGVVCGLALAGGAYYYWSNKQEIASLVKNCRSALEKNDMAAAVRDCALAAKQLEKSDPESLSFAEALENLGDVSGRIREAPGLTVAKYQRAAEIRKSLQDSDSPEMASLRLKLAHALVVAGKFDEADKMVKSALKIREAHYGEDAPEQAEALMALATVQMRQKDLANAEQNLRKALSIREAALDANDPLIGETFAALGQVYQQAGKLADAENYLRKALAILEPTASEREDVVTPLLTSLANIAQATNKVQDAGNYWNKLLKLTFKGADKPTLDYAAALHGVGLFEYHLQRYDKAANAVNNALVIREKLLGRNHPLTADSAMAMAMAWIALKQPARAEPLLRHAAAVAQTALGAKHPLTLQRWQVLAQLYAGSKASQAPAAKTAKPAATAKPAKK